ncbi:ChrR family anti-sigma-E factor [Neptunomonas japonica]|uniref:Anti-ECFsigma factor ChrR n=1 Tax=Neptunomonas japonica JAMM 1380 TaxID=1441457 RepID=A0A7R6PTQ9_9GAMM|nr:ChrR family anti-sigma-E factor [Neptunomonas japonica]BBB30290.1 anti-ECFsigma factor ChrR [Neptunomonas japonica JAMM 1380]
MNIKHHLDEATLMSYAAGSMSQAMALVVACHLSMCTACRNRAHESEAIGGMLLDNLKPAPVGDDALAQVLACIDGLPELEAEPSGASLNTSLNNRASCEKAESFSSNNDQITSASSVPSPLDDYIGSSLEHIEWNRIVPGVHYHDLPCKTERGGVSRLLRIAPGKAMLPHSHDGNELTLILRGSFTDEVGRFTVGDIADLDNEIQHQPLVDSNEDCICLIATDAPLKFSTLLGKIVQPMTGF